MEPTTGNRDYANIRCALPKLLDETIINLKAIKVQNHNPPVTFVYALFKLFKRTYAS